MISVPSWSSCTVCGLPVGDSCSCSWDWRCAPRVGQSGRPRRSACGALAEDAGMGRPCCSTSWFASPVILLSEPALLADEAPEASNRRQVGRHEAACVCEGRRASWRLLLPCRRVLACGECDVGIEAVRYVKEKSGIQSRITCSMAAEQAGAIELVKSPMELSLPSKRTVRVQTKCMFQCVIYHSYSSSSD